MAELPVTTTVLLRAIQGIAFDHGFDPADRRVRLQCDQVFAAAGPMARDDGADLAFLSARITLTGAALARGDLRGSRRVSARCWARSLRRRRCR